MSVATYDGDDVRITETTGTGGSAVTQDFVWNTTTNVPQLLMDGTNAYIYGPGSTPIEQVNLSSGTLKYLVGDSLGSVRGVVSSSGSLTASTSYSAYGNPETTGGLSSYTPFRLRRWLHRCDRIGLPDQQVLRTGDRAVLVDRSDG